MTIRPRSFILLASMLSTVASVTFGQPQHETPKSAPPTPAPAAPAAPTVPPVAPPATTPAAAPAVAAPMTVPADMPEAKALIAKHVEALGGRTKLDGITSSRYKASLASPMGPVSLEFAAKKPGMLKIKQSMPGAMDNEMASDGKLAWTCDLATKQYQLVDDAMKAQMTDGADLQGLIRALDTRFAKLTTVGKKDFNGASCWVVKMQDASGPEMTGYFDEKTGLIAGIEQSGPSPQGEMTQVTRVSDWADVDGIKVCKVMTTDVMGMSMKMEFSDFEFNKLEDAFFAAPDQVKAMAATPATAPAVESPKPAAPATDAPAPAAPKH